MMQRLTIFVICLVFLGVVNAIVHSPPHNRYYKKPSVHPFPTTPAPSKPKCDYNKCLKRCSYQFDGCYRDSQSKRILEQKAAQLHPNGPHECQEFCAGFRYFGVAFGDGCFCGNTVRNRSPVPHGCSKPCNGNPLLNCGDVDELQVYVLECP